MKRIFSFLIVLTFAALYVPHTGFGAAVGNVYLPDSTGHQLNWEFTETPPKRPKPNLLNSAIYEAKWKIDNPLLFSLVQDRNGILYVSDSDDIIHSVYPNGKKRWSLRLDMGFELPVIHIIPGQDGTIYAYSSDVLETGLTTIYALSPEGNVKWKHSSRNIYSQFNSEFAGDPQGNFVYFTDEGLVSRNAKGEVNWTHNDISTSDPRRFLESLHRAKLYVDSKGTIYTDNANKEIISLDSTGNERWRSKPQNYLNDFSVFHPFFSDADLLYMLTIDGLHALNASNGNPVIITSQSDLNDIRSSGLPTDGKGDYYIEYRGNVQKIGYDGTLKWSYVLRATEKYGLAYIDTLTTDDKGNVYFPTGVGNIIGLNSEGQEIFVFLRNAFWGKITEIVVGSNGNIYSSLSDIGLAAFGKKQIQVYLDNLHLSLTVAPINDKGSVLVPFRSFFESLGLTVDWDPVTQTITGEKEGLSIEMRIGSTTAYVNGEAKPLTIAPKIANNSTYVPLRFVGEALGKNVSWDSKSSSVNIDSKSTHFK